MKLLKFTLCAAFAIASAACMKPNKSDSAGPATQPESKVQGDTATVASDEATQTADGTKQNKDGAQSKINAATQSSLWTLLSTESETVNCLTNEIRSNLQSIGYVNALFGQLTLNGPQNAIKLEQTDFSVQTSGWILFKKENQLSLLLRAEKLNKEKLFKINFASSTGWQLSKNLDSLAFRTKSLKSKVNLVGLLESKGRNLEYESNCLKPETLKDLSTINSSEVAWPSNVNALTSELKIGVFERIYPNTNYQEIESNSCNLLIGETLDKKMLSERLNICINTGQVKKSSLEEICDLQSLQTTKPYQQYKIQRQLSERLFSVDQNRKSQPAAPAQLSLDNEEFEVSSKTFDKKGLIEADSALIFKVESAYNDVIMGLKTCKQ